MTKGRVPNHKFIRLLKCVLNADGIIPSLVDLNCVDGILMDSIQFDNYIGYHVDTETIGRLKRLYPTYSDKLAAVDVFRYVTGVSQGATMAVALGLLHRQTNPIAALYNLIKLHRPAKFVGSVLTGALDSKSGAEGEFTMVRWDTLYNIPGLTGGMAMRLTDGLFYTIFTIETERILLNGN